MPLIDLRAARAEIRLAAVLGLLGWRARERRGEQVRGPCPVHRSSSPGSRSFSAHLGRNAWRCFVCEAKGNALDLWARATGSAVVPGGARAVPATGASRPLAGAGRAAARK
jgi:hypothetical protein